MVSSRCFLLPPAVNGVGEDDGPRRVGVAGLVGARGPAPLRRRLRGPAGLGRRRRRRRRGRLRRRLGRVRERRVLADAAERGAGLGELARLGDLEGLQATLDAVGDDDAAVENVLRALSAVGTAEAEAALAAVGRDKARSDTLRGLAWNVRRRSLHQRTRREQFASEVSP